MKYLLFLSALLVACSAQRPLTLNEPQHGAMEHALDATVALVSEEGRTYCAGVSMGTRVLTAAHCVDGVTEALVAYRDMDVGGGFFSESHPYTVAFFNAEQDLAILNVMDRSEPPAEAPMSPSMPYAGQRVITIGHPVGLTYTITDGLVSYPRRTWNGQVYMQISSPIFFGNSGGPVFNRYGELLGISSFFVSQPHLGGAVHWEVIMRELGR